MTEGGKKDGGGGNRKVVVLVEAEAVEAVEAILAKRSGGRGIAKMSSSEIGAEQPAF